jgi:hypothetical protein
MEKSFIDTIMDSNSLIKNYPDQENIIDDIKKFIEFVKDDPFEIKLYGTYDDFGHQKFTIVKTVKIDDCNINIANIDITSARDISLSVLVNDMTEMADLLSESLRDLTFGSESLSDLTFGSESLENNFHICKNWVSSNDIGTYYVICITPIDNTENDIEDDDFAHEKQPTLCMYISNMVTVGLFAIFFLQTVI